MRFLSVAPSTRSPWTTPVVLNPCKSAWGSLIQGSSKPSELRRQWAGFSRRRKTYGVVPPRGGQLSLLAKPSRRRSARRRQADIARWKLLRGNRRDARNLHLSQGTCRRLHFALGRRPEHRCGSRRAFPAYLLAVEGGRLA